MVAQVVKFYAYTDMYSSVRRFLPGVTEEEFYTRELGRQSEINNTTDYAQAHWEYWWRQLRRPYYRVYPKVVQALTRLNIDRVIADKISPPPGLKQLIVDMPVGNKLMDDGRDIRHLFWDFEAVKTSRGTPHLTLGINYGEVVEADEVVIPMWDIWFFPLSSISVAAQLEEIERVGVDRQLMAAVDRHVLSDRERRLATCLMLTLCLIGENPELISPDVLSADEMRVNAENRQRLVEKARRRGRYGWSVGSGVEMSPHFRVDHLALFHTGKGRTVPVVQMRRGALVRRKKVESIPTGRLDEEHGQHEQETGSEETEG